MPKLVLMALFNWRSIVKAVAVLVGIFVVFVMLAQILVLSLLQKSMFTWPVAAPTVVDPGDSAYLSTGWTLAGEFGWHMKHDSPGTYELREGIELTGDTFCLGCAVPPVLDIQITENGVRWDQEWASDPMTAGAGVVVEFEIQHPDESGMLDGEKTYGLYGHLQPYRVYIRTQSCQIDVSCPNYRNSSNGAVNVTCQGRVVETDRSRGERAYAYATPGQCRASVSWPADWEPDGPVVVTFDQQIAPGAQSADAAISFRAQEPAPPTPTPTPVTLGPVSP